MNKIKKNDKVVVIAGKDKGQTGVVLSLEGDRILVEGINIVSRATKKNEKFPEGGFIKKSVAIHKSNIALLSPKLNKATRVKIETNAEGKKQRVAVKCGSILP